MSRAGELGVERALERLRVFPFDAGPAATLDTQRELRTGFREVILAERKSPEDVVSAFARLAGAAGLLMATRCTGAHATACCSGSWA